MALTFDHGYSDRRIQFADYQVILHHSDSQETHQGSKNKKGEPRWMEKILLTIVLITGSSLVGLSKSTQLKQRVMLLEQTMMMTQKLKTCLQYEKMTTHDMIDLLVQSDGGKELLFLEKCLKKMEDGMIFPQAWKQSIEQCKSKVQLTDEDYHALCLIGTILGSASAHSQLSQLKVMEDLLKQCVQDARQQLQNKGTLYRSLGVLGGVGIAVLIW